MSFHTTLTKKQSQQLKQVNLKTKYYRLKTRKFTVAQDEGPRRDTTKEALAGLKPAFKVGGSVTAGNSSQTSDGAAFVIVASERAVKEYNLTPIARLVTTVSVGVD